MSYDVSAILLPSFQLCFTLVFRMNKARYSWTVGLRREEGPAEMYSQIFSPCILLGYESNLGSKPHKSDCKMFFVAPAATHIPSMTNVEPDLILKSSFIAESSIAMVQGSGQCSARVEGNSFSFIQAPVSIPESVEGKTVLQQWSALTL